jgi:hypothetical protein
MDRYFYIVEIDGDRKVVHMSGNVYFNDADETETCYRITEWTFFYMTIDEIQKLFEELRFYDYINERVDYMGSRTEDEALAICREYFNGTPGNMLHITQVNEDTPCGDYWFE